MDKVTEIAVRTVNGNGNMPQEFFFNIMLREFEKIMECPIAYFASVEDDEKKLVMRGWSRNVMSRCKILKKPLEYVMEETGIWTDCVRERKPVIVNDYADYNRPTKKGYPAEHVEVTRHLSVPVFEDGMIVGVLGVGNKSTPFTDADSAKMLEFINAVWGTVKKKCI